MTTRALVLGGGGVTGVAWMTGLLVGLLDAGIDLADADLVVGTSAGSMVGAQVATRADLRERYAAQLAGPGSELAARVGLSTRLALAGGLLRSFRDPVAFRSRIGRHALAASTVAEQARLDVIAARLPVHTWPESPRLLVPAVDATTGQLRVFDAASGVPLVTAVAASCAVPGVWPPVTIGDRRYVDGGVASAANADLAAGHDRVVIIAPITTGLGPVPAVEVQAAALRSSGQVLVVSPDSAAKTAIGRNNLDPARRSAAARAGHAQAATAASAVATVWTG